jgi:hypothetical protein
MSTRALAKSVQDFDAMPPADQSESMIGFLGKMTDDLSQKNPQLATTSRIISVDKQPGKPCSEGLENVYAELGAVEELAKQRKADLSKIQVESIARIRGNPVQPGGFSTSVSLAQTASSVWRIDTCPCLCQRI